MTASTGKRPAWNWSRRPTAAAMALRMACETEPCSHCGADAGERCEIPGSGGRIARSGHAVRWAAASLEVERVKRELREAITKGMRSGGE